VIAASAAAEILDSAQGYLWILLAAVVLWRLFPVLHKRLESDDITVESGGRKVSLQSASSQLQLGLDDLREQVIGLTKRFDDSIDQGNKSGALTASDAAATREEVPAPPVRILWVDDHPENNALVIDSLKSREADIVDAATTDEALAKLTSDRRGFDIVISDMGRDEPKGYRPEAGIELVRRLRESSLAIPVVIYASQRAITSSGTAALEAGAAAATASPTELLTTLRIGPTTAFEASVGDIVRRHLKAAAFPIRKTVDFVAVRDGERIGIEIKNWVQQPARASFEHALELVGAARERFGFDRILMITREKIEAPTGIELPAWLTVETVDELNESLTG